MMKHLMLHSILLFVNDDLFPFLYRTVVFTSILSMLYVQEEITGSTRTTSISVHLELYTIII